MATIPEEAVLSTTELLEEILSHLDMRTLLLSQRTCQLFHQTIKRSITLQRKLFLEPATSVDGSFIINPLLETRIHIGFGFMNLRFWSSGRKCFLIFDAIRYKRSGDMDCASDGFKPMSEPYGPDESTPENSFPNNSGTMPSHLKNKLDSTTSNVANGRYPVRPRLASANPTCTSSECAKFVCASWRRMLLCQPQLGGRVSSVSYIGPGAITSPDLEFTEGLNLGQVVDAMMAMVIRNIEAAGSRLHGWSREKVHIDRLVIEIDFGDGDTA